MEALNARFKEGHAGADVKTSTGSSGNLFAQIQRSAPFDLFLSADMRYPEALIRSGRVEATNLVQYGIGRIVLWTLNTNVVVTRGLSELTSSHVRRIAIANPEHAPYGRAAKAALQKGRLWENLQPKLVFAENVAQAAEFVETRSVDVGIVAMSLLSTPKLRNTATRWLIPEERHPRLDQGAVLTRRGSSNARARAYWEFLRSKQAREILPARRVRSAVN
jgi:molybdate transport system substrate-binding protein